jgi:peptidoglycan/LPS O-acetylase OafA/YrhL
VIAFALSLLIAWLMHHLIEKPCAKLKKRFAARWVFIIRRPVSNMEADSLHFAPLFFCPG